MTIVLPDERNAQMFTRDCIIICNYHLLIYAYILFSIYIFLVHCSNRHNTFTFIFIPINPLADQYATELFIRQNIPSLHPCLTIWIHLAKADLGWAWDSKIVTIATRDFWEQNDFRLHPRPQNVCQSTETGQITAFCNISYRKTSSISRTKSQNLNVSCIPLQLSSLNPLKPGVKLRMKM